MEAVRSVLVLVLAAVLAGCGGAAFTPALDGQPVAVGDAGGVGAEVAPPPEPGSEPQQTATTEAGPREAADGRDAVPETDAGPPEETGTHVVQPDAGRDAPTTVAPDAGPDVADSGAVPDVVTGACTVGSTRCMGAQPLLCVAGAWEGAGPACTATPCIAGACAACSPGATQCAGGTQPQTCSATGTWQDSGSPNAHNNGIGQSWVDCTPAGTIDEAEAMRACAAHTGDPSQCQSTNGCGGGTGVVDDGKGDNWGYQGFPAGHVQTGGSCPSSTSPAWN